MTGYVRSGSTAYWPSASPSAGTTVIAYIYDADTGSTITGNATSDDNGHYSILLVSPVLTRQYYTVTVVPSKVDVITSPNGTVIGSLIHVFSTEQSIELSTLSATTNSTAAASISSSVTHTQQLLAVNFYDFSDIGVTGSVILNSNVSLSTFSEFDGCGVENVVINVYSAAAYAAAVTSGTAALLLTHAAPTAGTFGIFSFRAAIDSNLVLVPQLSSHSFVPSYIAITVSPTGVMITSDTPTGSLQFVDVTTSIVTASLVGGVYSTHMGTVTAAFELVRATFGRP